ncbi:MAG: 2-hydroxyacyl-CoA dehydratase [Pirellulales bacterium]|nr:2-hydroxyacyl-CoA dehydratase [Pirellulales bacterium]
MKTVAYCHPLVPSEWIEAHGLRARWTVPRHSGAGAICGMCPYAQAVVDTLAGAGEETIAVLTTACDQMRHGAGLLAEGLGDRVFLLNVPSTWQSPASRAYYTEELQRLGRWLVGWGGRRPAAGQLAQVMADHDRARNAFRHGQIPDEPPSWCNPVAVRLAAEAKRADRGGVALGIVGGPLMEHDLAIVEWINAAGGRIVLDATCGGYRTLPERFDPSAIERDALAELIRAYFDHVPTIHQRPGSRLHDWLANAIREHRAEGLLCLRYVWCDLWHAEVARLKETAGVTILDMDLGDEDRGGEGRVVARLEAMIESLRKQPR